MAAISIALIIRFFMDGIEAQGGILFQTRL